MPEEQAFCVLVKMMFDYGLRDLFKQGFEELHLRFYQLERLMQVFCELVSYLYSKMVLSSENQSVKKKNLEKETRG